MNSTVAVIIASYNYARFLPRTLASVFAQTLPPDQIIVVDDNSTDGTYELLESFVPRISLVRKPRNVPRGPAASQNLALKMTTAEYVAFLDADDLWAPDKLRLQLEAFRSNPDAGLCYCNGKAIDSEDKPLYTLLPESHTEPDDPGNLLLNCYIVSPSAVMVRRDVLTQVGPFIEHMRYAHDHDMWVRIHEISRFIYLPTYLMYYRRHPEQASRQREMWEQGFGILKAAARRYPYSFSIRRKRWAVLRYRLGEYHWRRGEDLRALVNFSLAGAADPGRAAEELFRRLQIKFGRTARTA